MNKERYRFAFLAFAVILTSCDLQGQGIKDQFKHVIGQSDFIFNGTITHLDSSNIDVKLKKRKKAVVRIDEVIDATEPLYYMKGKEITMAFASDSNHKNNDKQVFYSFIWYYGKTLGVSEVPNNLEKKFHPLLKNQIRQARLAIIDDSLRAEINHAELVIVAVVRSVSKTNIISGLEPSEHNPDLYRADFRVRKILKGTPKKDGVSTYFALSRDVLWINSPKLSVGMKGIFLLHKNQVPDFFNLHTYTSLDPRDFQEISKWKKVKSLIKSVHHNDIL